MGEIDESRIASIEKDIRNVKEAIKRYEEDMHDIKNLLQVINAKLVGDEYDEDGLMKRTKNNEKEIAELKTQRRVEKAAMIAGGTVAGWVLTKGLEVLSKIL